MATHEKKEWTLEDVQNHFSSWRAKRPRPKRIPDELWDEAVGLLSQYSVNKVAKALRLEGRALKAKAVEAGVKIRSRTRGKAARPTAPTFLETSVGRIVGKGTEHQAQSGWNITIKRSDGLEMTINGSELSESALQGLVDGFCQRRA